MMEYESDEEAPDLVPISTPKIPVTIITGYLGTVWTTYIVVKLLL